MQRAPLLLILALGAACSRTPSTTEQGAPSPSVSQPLATNAPAPDVTFPLHTGEALKLSSLRGKPVVVYFYPKDDTPGCTVEAQEIRDVWSELKSTGAVVIGVSSDDAASHQAFAEKHALPFLLVPDSDHAIAHKFGV